MSIISNKTVFKRLMLSILILFLLIPGCKRADTKAPDGFNIYDSEQDQVEASKDNLQDTDNPTDLTLEPVEPVTNDAAFLINRKGTNLEERIQPPKGYTRVPSSDSELVTFLRKLPLKEDGSKVLLYNGEERPNQASHIAIFDLELSDRDLQQCADSVIRIYAEYYWAQEEYDKIAFHLTNGFLMEYTKWRDGNRIVVDGNEVRWEKTASYDASYNSFHKYLNMVFAYAGTLSLKEESHSIALEDLRPGDMFLQGGSPGHCVLVVDIAKDDNDHICFLLAQGYMPAQDFHIVKNPLHPEDPWYYTSEITYPLQTPQWNFDEGSLVRWGDFPLNQEDDDHGYPNISTQDGTVPAMSYEVSSNTEEDTTSVTLLAVGDNLIHIQVIESGKQRDGSYNYDHLYENLKDQISSADLAIINQETILGGNQFPYSGYPSFNSPTEIGDAIINAGFDIVLHATNHTMDMGLKGVMNTFKYWEEHPEITVLGINKTKEDSEVIPIIEKNNIKIAMLNYTYGLNGYHVPDDMPYLVNMLDKQKLRSDIKKAKEQADFVIVFPHWGTEYVYEATNTQKNLTNFFYDLGVDLVIGTHPHVLEPVEWIKTEEDHTMLVYYSLGNFISYQREAPRLLGGIATITLTKDSSHTYISKADIIPIVTHYENGPADYNYGIFPLKEYTSEQAKEHGVKDLQKKGPFTYEKTLELAEEILGSWYTK